MKGIITLLVIMLLSASANAGPYFRLFDYKNPKISGGVFADFMGNDTPDSGALVGIINHSTKDGSLFKSFQSDWSLLGIGGGAKNGEAFVAVGPSVNMLPAAKNSALAVLDWLAPGKYQNLKQLLSPKPGEGPDINAAFGPAFLFKPIEDNEVLAPNRWRGQIRWFAGAAWQF